MSATYSLWRALLKRQMTLRQGRAGPSLAWGKEDGLQRGLGAFGGVCQRDKSSRGIGSHFREAPRRRVWMEMRILQRASDPECSHGAPGPGEHGHPAGPREELTQGTLKPQTILTSQGSSDGFCFHLLLGNETISFLGLPPVLFVYN